MRNKLLSRSFDYAAYWHRHQRRKGSDVPYIAHLMAVSALVLEHGGTDVQAAGALLHDVAEDQGGRKRLREIKRKFGKDVEQIVRDCSDSLRKDPKRKKKWKKRKKAYIERLETVKKTSLLVSCADKLHNARATVEDSRRIGPAVWDKLNGGPEGQAWYYREVSRVCSQRLTKEPAASLAHDLAVAVAHLELEAAKAG
ncbi:MAG TPA: HD domain-containing protein [Acidimicrobiales bacterium]|nr:HD domain-containing protein [Acidimicrobiales bacterium]